MTNNNTKAPKITPRLLLGLEVECEYNPQKVNKQIIPGAYHEGKKVNTYWFAQSDASVRAHTNGWRVVELTSRPFEAADLPKALASLRRIFKKGASMSETMKINDTCGSHVHFSLVYDDGHESTMTLRHSGKDYEFKGVPRSLPLGARFMKRIREDVLKFLPDAAKARYFRQYSQKTTRGKIQNGDRYAEFNYISAEHCEYRSFNLTGVNTWDAFESSYAQLVAVLDKYLLKTKYVSEAGKVLFNMPTVPGVRNETNAVPAVGTAGAEVQHVQP